MRLREVGIRHFRNLAVQELEIPSEGLALIGENAQGKSNFLEAIYYLETFRSFRGAPDEHLVGVGQEAPVGEQLGRQLGVDRFGQVGHLGQSLTPAAGAGDGHRSRTGLPMGSFEQGSCARGRSR